MKGFSLPTAWKESDWLRPLYWDALVLFARAVAMCQSDPTGFTLVVAKARYSAPGIGRLSAQTMLAGILHPAGNACATYARIAERDAREWHSEQDGAERAIARKKECRIVTVRSATNGKVKRYEVPLMVAPTFYDIDVDDDYRIRTFSTKANARHFVGL